MGKKGERYEVVSPYDENGLFILKNKQKSKMIIHYLQWIGIGKRLIKKKRRTNHISHLTLL